MKVALKNKDTPSGFRLKAELTKLWINKDNDVIDDFYVTFFLSSLVVVVDVFLGRIGMFLCRETLPTCRSRVRRSWSFIAVRLMHALLAICF